jgi:hypothetical protein
MVAGTAVRTLAGPAGALECAITAPDTAPAGVALIAHPHPLYGGTMDNKVVQTLARAFVSLGWVAWRMNFRGVGASDGLYDDGVGEIDDFRALVAAAREAHPGLPVALAGFSFGGYVASRVAAEVRPARLVLIAPAVGRFDVATVPEHTLVVHGEQDDVVPLAEVLDWARPQKLPVVVVPGAGHFFHGDLMKLHALVRAFRADAEAPTA